MKTDFEKNLDKLQDEYKALFGEPIAMFMIPPQDTENIL